MLLFIICINNIIIISINIIIIIIIMSWMITSNSHSIFLLSVACKVLAKIMLTRLLEHVDLVLPEFQCG